MYSGTLFLSTLAAASTVSAAFTLRAGPVAFNATGLPLRIVSFNIRRDPGPDLAQNEQPWWTVTCGLGVKTLCRRYLLGETLQTYVEDASTAVIGLQEVLSNQLTDVLVSLGPNWGHIGVGRDDGKAAGEHNPILYNEDVLSVVFNETKWLSPTPDEVSLGWAAGSRRIVTLGVFEHIATGKRFIHANTHLDNSVASQARVEGIKVVIARIKAAQALYGPLGVTLTGDFNADPTEDAYVTLKGLGYLVDLWDMAKHVGPNQLTYSGFKAEGVSRIDHIWYGPAGESLYSPVQIEIVSNGVDGVYISDHRLVYGDVVLHA